MWRPWMVLTAIFVMAGCKGSGPSGTATDPFFGRTRVEPPRTGAVFGRMPQGANPSTTPGSGTIAPNATAGQGIARPSGFPANSTVPNGQTPGGQPNWTPAQPKVNPVPAAIPPQTGSVYGPPDGSFGFPGAGKSVATGASLAGSGDRLSIPSAARTSAPFSSDPGIPGTNSPSGLSGANPDGMGGRTSRTAGPATGTSGMAGPSAATPYLDPVPPAGLPSRERIVRDIERTASAPNPTPRFSPYPANSTTANGGNATPPPSGKEVNIADLPESK
jgi:hypothetical protein